MIICIIIEMNWKRLLHTQDLHGIFTACTQRADSALEDPAALPQNAV